MKPLVKITIWFIAVITILTFVFVIATSVFERQVTDILVKAVNSQISVKLDFETARLHLFKKFPRASVELYNATVFSSPAFSRKDFQGIETGMLLKAGRASLEFSLKDLINKNYTIESISVSNGEMFLLTDSTGGVNYEIHSATPPDGNSIINLEKVSIRGLSVNYINKATGITISGIIENSKIKAVFRGADLDLLITSGFTLGGLDVKAVSIHPGTRLNADIKLSRKEGELIFDRSILKFEGFTFDITGIIRPGENILLKIAGNEIDLAKIKKYLPGKLSEKYGEYLPGGRLNAEIILSGPISRVQNLQSELKFSVKNGRIFHKKSDIRLENLALSGSYTNGKMAAPATSKVEITDCSFNIGNADYSGLLLIENFVNPFIRINFSGELIPAEIQKFFRISWLLSSEGSARINFRAEGYPGKKKNYSLTDLLSLGPVSTIQLKSFGIRHKDPRLSFRDATGFLMVASSLWAEDLSFEYNNQRFVINGCFENFPEWISGKPSSIKINASVHAGRINIPELFHGLSAAQSENNITDRKAFILPGGIEAVIKLYTESISWGKLKTGNVSGIINYKPRLLTVKDFSTDSFNGNISGSFLASGQGNSRGLLFQGNFSIKDVNLRECFKGFNNFSQNFIVAENLSGSLSGSLKMLMQFDTLLRPDFRSLNAEGKYIIENGALINFEPVKALSKFIKVNELENITFSRLENDLFIRNNYLAIPQMDIFSSAADFTVSGTHYFDNTYEYHIKAYLSELLSGKLKNNRLTSEFGAIEDDGLGRTSVFLKVTGKGGDVKVTYDLRAAGNKIKESLRNEKNNLRKILNEEYRPSGKDTARIFEPAPRPRFKVEWEETDNPVYIQQDTARQEKENLFDRIFRKKKNENN